jgi:hypothetical protein
MGVSHKGQETLEYSPFLITPPGNENAVWLKPELVCVVQYMPNDKGSLRHYICSNCTLNEYSTMKRVLKAYYFQHPFHITI